LEDCDIVAQHWDQNHAYEGLTHILLRNSGDAIGHELSVESEDGCSND